jgi:hypothetical protein
MIVTGANLEFRGTGAPGFDGKSAFDIAVAKRRYRDDRLLRGTGN